MKKKFFMRRLICTAFIAAAGFAAHAQTIQVKQQMDSPAASVQYMGSRQDILSVAVRYDNEAGKRFVVTVRDQDGYQLFEGSFTEKKFNKIFQLPKAAISKLVFSIRNTGNDEVQSFEVNAKTMEEAVVKRIG